MATAAEPPFGRIKGIEAKSAEAVTPPEIASTIAASVADQPDVPAKAGKAAAAVAAKPIAASQAAKRASRPRTSQPVRRLPSGTSSAIVPAESATADAPPAMKAGMKAKKP